MVQLNTKDVLCMLKLRIEEDVQEDARVNF